MADWLRDAAAAWAVTYLMHSTILLGGVWLITRGLGLRWSALEDLLWKAAVVGSLITSTIGLAGRNSARPGPGESGVAAPATASPEPVVTESPVLYSPMVEIAAGNPDAALSVSGEWRRMAVSVWLSGAAVLLLLLLARSHRLRRLLSGRLDARSTPVGRDLRTLLAESRARRRVAASVAPALAGPVALAREICVPPRALQLAAGLRRTMVAHELAHVLRRDPWWLRFMSVLEAVLFFQPLNRVATRELRRTAEVLCDEWAIAATGSELDLIRCLSEVAGWTGATPQPGIALSQRPSQLMARVRHILEGRRAKPMKTYTLLPILAVTTLLGSVMPAQELPLRPVAPEPPGAREHLPEVEPLIPGGPETPQPAEHELAPLPSTGLIEPATPATEPAERPVGSSMLDTNRVSLSWTENDSRFQVRIVGDVVFIDDYGGVEWTSEYGRLEALEARGDGRQRVVARPSDSGTVYDYTRNGAGAELDAAARRWMRDIFRATARRLSRYASEESDAGRELVRQRARLQDLERQMRENQVSAERDLMRARLELQQALVSDRQSVLQSEELVARQMAAARQQLEILNQVRRGEMESQLSQLHDRMAELQERVNLSRVLIQEHRARLDVVLKDILTTRYRDLLVREVPGAAAGVGLELSDAERRRVESSLPEAARALAELARGPRGASLEVDDNHVEVRHRASTDEIAELLHEYLGGALDPASNGSRVALIDDVTRRVAEMVRHIDFELSAEEREMLDELRPSVDRIREHM